MVTRGFVPALCAASASVSLSLIAAVIVTATVAMPPALLAADQNAPASGEVRVAVDRNVVRQNQRFGVKFIADTAAASDPDWKPLNKDFHVEVGGKQLRKKIVNGVERTTQEWGVHLRPKRAGKLKIPPLQFGALRSREVAVNVKPAPKPAKPKKQAQKKREDFFIEVSAQPNNPYVQAQVLFTLKVFMLHSLRGSVSPPQSSNKALVEALGDARNYRAKRDGRNYNVYEGQYLIYPQTSGDVKIQPISLDGHYVRGGRRQRVRKKSQVLTLKVRPIPASFPGKFWVPAEKFTIKEDWSGDLASWRAGEPLTRTLNLEAKGLLAKQVPEIDLSEVGGFRVYTEQADFKNQRKGKTIIGKRQQAVVMIPAQAGAYKLPNVRVPWWNTRDDRLEFAELPAKEIMVDEAAFGMLMMEEPSSTVVADVTETNRSTFGAAIQVRNPWFWVSAALLTGWLANLALTSHGKGLYRRFKATRRRRLTMKKLLADIRRAASDQDAAATKDLLMQWGRMTWPADPPTSVKQIAARFGGLMVQQVEQMEAVLYGRNAEWKGSLLWDAFSSQELKEEYKPQPSDDLQPLHKL